MDWSVDISREPVCLKLLSFVLFNFDARRKTLNCMVAAPCEEGWSTSELPEATKLKSRCFTLYSALLRLGIVNKNPQEDLPAVLSVHVIGCDPCDLCCHDPLDGFKFLRNLLSKKGCSEVRLLLCGPNCRHGHVEAHSEDQRRETDDALDFPKISITSTRLLYHEYCEQFKPTEPNIVIAFNAGLWGYSSWQQTLELLLGSQRSSTPLVVTSYSPEEAEMDRDTIREVQPCTKWIWEPEENPYRSLVPWPQSDGTLPTAYENAYSQCVIMNY